MAGTTVNGRFVWHELVTPQSAASQGFYTKALGWKIQSWEGDAAYTMFAGPNGPLGATVVDANAAPHWVIYVAVDDIDATVERARGLGGSVLQAVTEIGEGAGRYAVLTDPQGVKFGVYGAGAAGSTDQESAARPGEFSWHELATTDATAALSFYGALFGWEEVDKIDMGPIGFYHLFGRKDHPIGGIFNRSPEIPCSAWLGYVRVKALEKVVKKVQAGGGTLVMPPMEVPGGDWIAQFMDPQGAQFAVHEVKADREAAQAAAAAKSAAAAVSEPAPTRARPKRSVAKAAQPGASSKPKAGAKAKAPAKARVKAKANTKLKAKAKAKAAKPSAARTAKRSRPRTKLKTKARTRLRATLKSKTAARSTSKRKTRKAANARRSVAVKRASGKKSPGAIFDGGHKKSVRRPARRAK